jgi:hypothetical protein
MNNINYLFLVFALLAEIIGTIGGFGSSVFFVPLGNFYFDFHTVLGLTAVFHLSSNLSKIILFKKGLDKNLLLYIGLPSVIFVIIGGIVSRYLDIVLLELLLGIFLVVLSLLFLVKQKLVIEPNKENSITGGILSGFSAGLLGTGGAIRENISRASLVYNLNELPFATFPLAIKLIAMPFCERASMTCLSVICGWTENTTIFVSTGSLLWQPKTIVAIAAA